MKHILLIEDDLVLRENTAELLELSGYRVTVASDGLEGVKITKSKKPDIIVCDIMMPELDGYGVLNALAKNHNTKYIPFIFLSAKTEHRDVRKGMVMGADDYITKPFSEEELISAIESRLAKRAILADLREKKNSSNRNSLYEGDTNSRQGLKAFFDDNGEAFNYLTDEIIYKEGNNSNYIYLLNKGVVRCYKLDEQGKELTTALCKKGDLFGYSSFIQNSPYQETATVIKDAEIIGVTKSMFKKGLNKNHKVALDLIQCLTDGLTGVKDQLLQMAYSTVNKKTAATIIKFAEKMNNTPEDPIKISRSDLASVAGIATETLIRAIADFKRQGIIKMEGRNIKIVDIQKLKQMC